jgi:hypothetical protein
MFLYYFYIIFIFLYYFSNIKKKEMKRKINLGIFILCAFLLALIGYLYYYQFFRDGKNNGHALLTESSSSMNISLGEKEFVTSENFIYEKGNKIIVAYKNNLNIYMEGIITNVKINENKDKTITFNSTKISGEGGYKNWLIGNFYSAETYNKNGTGLEESDILFNFDEDGNLLTWQMNSQPSDSIQGDFEGTPVPIVVNSDGALRVAIENNDTFAQDSTLQTISSSISTVAQDSTLQTISSSISTVAQDSTLQTIAGRIPTLVDGATPVFLARDLSVKYTGFHSGAFAVATAVAGFDTAVSATGAAIPFPGGTPVRARIRVVSGSLSSSFEVFMRGYGGGYVDQYRTGMLDVPTAAWISPGTWSQVFEFGFTLNGGEVPSGLTLACEYELSGVWTAFSRFQTHGWAGQSMLPGLMICPPGRKLTLSRLEVWHESGSGSSVVIVEHLRSFTGNPRGTTNNRVSMIGLTAGAATNNRVYLDVVTITEGALSIRYFANNLILQIGHSWRLDPA